MVFKTPLAGLTRGMEFFSIPVASGTHRVSTVWHKLGDYIVTNANNEQILTNRDTDRASTFLLDATISPGMRFTVVKLAEFDLTIQAPDGETIIDSTLGGCLRHTVANQLKSTVTLIKVDEKMWTVERGGGTWETDNQGA
ncbi:MAG: hypothetical protein JEZ12_22920 [Desulfobacterium sp.]|nr:hypothetical protein [Desulfobacterium sp.]